jgi:hypothetical protein
MDLMNFMYNDTKSLILKIIIFIIIFLVIFDQVVSLTMFAYNYNKYYDYGKMMRATCDTNYTEYETERFQIAQNLMNIKIGNDNTNTRYHLIIFILSIILALYINYFFTFMFFETMFADTTSTISKAFSSTNKEAASTTFIGSALSVVSFFKDEINEFINKNSILQRIGSYILVFFKVISILYLVFMLPISLIVKLSANVNISPFANSTDNLIPHSILLTIILIIGLTLGNKTPISYFSFILFFALYIVIYEYSMIMSDIYMNNNTSNIVNIYENSSNNNLKNMTFSKYYLGNTNTKDSIIVQILMNTFGLNNFQVNDFKLNFQTNFITKAILQAFGFKFDETNSNTSYDYNPIVIDNYNVVLLLFGFSVACLVMLYLFLLGIEKYGFTMYKTFSDKKLDSKVLYYFAIIPLLFLFIVLFIIMVNKEYNTMINKYILYEPHSLYKMNIQKVSSIFNQIIDNDKSSVANDSVCQNTANALHLVLYANLFKYYEKTKMFIPEFSYVSVCGIHDFIDYTMIKEYDFRNYTENIFYNDSKCISVNNELLSAIMKSAIPKFQEQLTEKDYAIYRDYLTKQFHYAVYNIINKKTYDGNRRLEITTDYSLNNTIMNIPDDKILNNLIDNDNSLGVYKDIIDDIIDEYILYNKTIYTYTIRIIQALCRCNDIEDFTTHGYDVLMSKIEEAIKNKTNSSNSFEIKKSYIKKYKEMTGILFDTINKKLTTKIKTSIKNRKLSKYIIQNYNNYIDNESYKYKKDELVLIDSRFTNVLADSNKYADIDEIQGHIETMHIKVDELAKFFGIDITYDPDAPIAPTSINKNSTNNNTDNTDNQTLIVEKTLELEELIDTLQQKKKNYRDIFKNKYYYSQDLNKQLVYDYKITYIDGMIKLHQSISDTIRNKYNFFQKYELSYTIKSFTDIDVSAIKKTEVQEFDYISYKKEYNNVKNSYENRYNTIFKLANDIFKMEINDIRYRELEKQEKDAKKLLDIAQDTSMSVYGLVIIYLIIIILAYYIK